MRLLVLLLALLCLGPARPPGDLETEDPLLEVARAAQQLLAVRAASMGLDLDSLFAASPFEVRATPGCDGDGAAPEAALDWSRPDAATLAQGGTATLRVTSRANETLPVELLEYAPSGAVRVLRRQTFLNRGASFEVCIQGSTLGSTVIRAVPKPEGTSLAEAIEVIEAPERYTEDEQALRRARLARAILRNDARNRVAAAQLAVAFGSSQEPGQMLLSVERAAAEPLAHVFGDALPKDATVLLFAAAGDALSVSLLRAGQPILREKLALDVASLTPLIDRLAAAAGAGDAFARAPRLRALEPVPWTSEPEPIAAVGAEVGEALLPPSLRPALADTDHLVVLPAGGLGRLPWYAVQLDGVPLVATTAVTILPDLSGLFASPGSWSATFESPLVVGDPTLAADDYPGLVLPPLSGAREEATEVARQLERTAVLGDAASLDAVGTRAPMADLLYFSTHGVADARSPMLDSFLALRGGGWTAADVLAADLSRAKLVVLSACQTGLGQDVAAGTIGLTRAFHQAGAPRVVMSLWNIDDQQTKRLMLDFVQGLETRPPSEALRAAADAARLRGAPPRVWASFSAFGSPR